MTTRNSESGNTFFIIMLGVILFAALMFAFTRGVRQGGDSMTDKQAEIAVSDVLAFGQKVERGVSRILGRGLSESVLSLDPMTVASTNLGCADNTCRVFHPDGGAVAWADPPANVNNGTPWIFNAHNFITGIGCDTAADPSCTDLVMFLRNVNLNVCMEINERLRNTPRDTPPPEDANNAVDETATYDGTVNQVEDLAAGGALNGKFAGCFEEAAGTYFFYYVLNPR